MQNALTHVQKIAERPHYTGAAEHSKVRNYILSALEELDLEPHVQQDFSTTYSYGLSIAIPENIIAKIEGENKNEPALVFMSHYDSAVYSSHGAADAASGVAAILEAVRAFKEKGVKPRQDIIILFTDTEEVGLNGAKLFVEKHPWAKNIGLVVNFEARGSSGASSMILEVNGGNQELIKHFSNANIDSPFANSLMYSVYKLLPNDTDSTIFRKYADVPSYFFAYIDDHFNYHTALDQPSNLDLKSLNQQGEYALSLLHYFSTYSLQGISSTTDVVYFNFPFLGMVYLSQSLVLFLTFFTFSATLFLNYLAIQKHQLSLKKLLYSFLYVSLLLIVAVVVGFLGWKIIAYFYPNYQLILHGFPYNGKSYIIAFLLFTLGLIVYLFKFLRSKFNAISFLSVGIYIWLLISIIAYFALPGASYFVIPAFMSCLILLAKLLLKQNNMMLDLVLSLPVLFIITPFLYYFPVGLGLASIFISCILLVLIFVLISPLFYDFKLIKGLNFLLICAGLFFFGKAHLEADFTENQPRPSSLNYLYNVDTKSAYWTSYDPFLSNWNIDYFKNDTTLNTAILESKYSNNFRYIAKAPEVDFATSDYDISLIGVSQNDFRFLLKIKPKPETKRIEAFVDTPEIVSNITVNAEPYFFDEDQSSAKHINRFFTYQVANQEQLSIAFSLPNKNISSLKLFETSFNLINHEKLKVKSRPENEMPMPFIINDAIIVNYTIPLNYEN